MPGKFVYPVYDSEGSTKTQVKGDECAARHDLCTLLLLCVNVSNWISD